MTEVVRACNPGDPVSEAAAIMGEARVRRLPVVDDSERVIGLLALGGSRARSGAAGPHGKSPEITMAEIGGLLAAICRPREIAIDWPSG